MKDAIDTWEQRLQAQAKRAFENYKTVRIDLAVAHQDLEIAMAGDFFYVYEASDSAAATVKLNRNTNPPLPIEPESKIFTVFTKFYLTNTAQANAYMNIVSGINFEYVKKNLIEGGDSIPQGVIWLWSGTIATIPAGWQLCDGTNGTPDLRDQFVVCARQDQGGVAKTNITGVLTQTGGTINHWHTLTAYAGMIAGGTDIDNTTDTQEHLPPYYALAYIMKL